MGTSANMVVIETRPVNWRTFKRLPNSRALSNREPAKVTAGKRVRLSNLKSVFWNQLSQSLSVPSRGLISQALRGQSFLDCYRYLTHQSLLLPFSPTNHRHGKGRTHILQSVTEFNKSQSWLFNSCSETSHCNSRIRFTRHSRLPAFFLAGSFAVKFFNQGLTNI